MKVTAVENYNQWEQLYAANPDAVAMIGLCAPDIASLGKLNAANGDKFVAGGYDLTEAEPARRSRTATPTCRSARAPSCRATCRSRMLSTRSRTRSRSRSGFYNAGTQIVTADSVDMGNGLPAISFDEAIKLAGDPAATADVLQAWTQKVNGRRSTARMQPIAAEAE